MENGENQYVGGYRLLTPLTSKNSGFAKWGKAEKDGNIFFIKEFLSPVMPGADAPLSDRIRRQKEAEARNFFEEKRKLYATIKEANTGNIIFIREFFLFQGHFYITTEFVEESGISMEDISKLSMDKKILLMKVLAYSLQGLHEKKIIHGDLKPQNILVKETIEGFYTVKLIDFDSSMFEWQVSEVAEELQGDMVYMAPEVFKIMIGENVKLTTKADIFSLGLLFTQYLTGKLPEISEEYDYCYEAVLNGETCRIPESIPKEYRKLIRMMLNVNPQKRPSLQQILKTLDEGKYQETKSPEQKPPVALKKPESDIFMTPQMYGDDSCISQSYEEGCFVSDKKNVENQEQKFRISENLISKVK